MEEIGLAALDQRVGEGGDNIVPAHMRNMDRLGRDQRADGAAEPPKAAMRAELVAARRHQLHADADAEERRALAEDARFHRLDHAGDAAQPRRAGAERADPGQNDAIGLEYRIGIGGDGDVARPRGFQRIMDRVEIARAVIDQRDAHDSSDSSPGAAMLGVNSTKLAVAAPPIR